MKKKTVTAIVLSLLCLMILVSCMSTEEGILRSLVNNMEATKPLPYIVDAMEIIVTGAGGPMPNDARRPPSVTVKVNSKVFLFDAGQGADLGLREQRIPLGDITSVFLTHFHFDHIAGLGEVKLNSWVSGRQNPLYVYGPEGLTELIDGVNKFYSFDNSYRIAHHSEAVIKYSAAPFSPNEFATPKEGEMPVVYTDGDFCVYAFLVNHDPVKPAVGYRLVYKEKVAIITGDTIYTENLVWASKNADVIFADGLDHELTEMLEKAAEKVGNISLMHIAQDIRTYQMDPTDCARLAQKAGAKHLVFVHVTPPILAKPLENIYLKGVDEIFDGKYEIANDGFSVVLK